MYKKYLFLILILFIFQSAIRAEVTDKEHVFKKIADKLSTVQNRLKNKTVAVYGFDMIGRKDDSYSRYATEKLTHELVEVGKLLIIERSRIDNLLKEQQLSMSGIIDADKAAKIGKILSVDGVIIGSIAVKDDEVEFIARVIQSESAIILKSANESYKTSTKIDTGASTTQVISNDISSDTQTDTGKIENTSYLKISLKKEIFPDSEKITIKYSGMPGNKYDWITLVKASRPDNQYAEWFYTQGLTKGSYTFKNVPPGEYEIRAYYDWPAGGYTVKHRLKIIVK